MSLHGFSSDNKLFGMAGGILFFFLRGWVIDGYVAQYFSKKQLRFTQFRDTAGNGCFGLGI